MARPGALFLVSLFLFAGCATHRIDWGARVGSYTYDQAVVDLGPPDKSAKLGDGTVVGDWLVRRGYPYVPGYAYYPYYPCYSPFYTPYPTFVSPDYYLRLTFAPDGRLSAWKNWYR